MMKRLLKWAGLALFWIILAAVAIWGISSFLDMTKLERLLLGGFIGLTWALYLALTEISKLHAHEREARLEMRTLLYNVLSVLNRDLEAVKIDVREIRSSIDSARLAQKYGELDSDWSDIIHAER